MPCVPCSPQLYVEVKRNFHLHSKEVLWPWKDLHPLWHTSSLQVFAFTFKYLHDNHNDSPRVSGVTR